MLNKDIIKLNHSISELHKTIEVEEQTVQELRHDLKLSKEELTNENIRTNKKANEF
jgi:hypothetical protein